jgi:hypothetical protein
MSYIQSYVGSWISPRRIVIGLLALAFYAGVRQKRDLVDFKVYETAATRALHGETLYRAEDGHWQFKYLPAFALVMAPFAVVPPEVGRGVWFALSCALLAVFLRQCIQALPDRRLTSSQLTWLTMLILGKCFVKELILGQTNLLFGVLSMSALLAARRDRRALSGLGVGLAVLVKPYALIFVPWLLLAAGVPALAAFAVVLMCGLALPVVTFGWHGNVSLLVSWYRTVTDTTATNLLFPENISFATMWAKWVGATVIARGLALLTVFGSVSVVGVTALMRRRVSQPDYLEFGLLMLLVPLISPQGWDYVLLLGAPVVMCIIDRWPHIGTGWKVAAAASFGAIGFTIFDLLGRTAYTQLMAWSVVTVGAIVCGVCAVSLREQSLA